jgi:hypothetical protein
VAFCRAHSYSHDCIGTHHSHENPLKYGEFDCQHCLIRFKEYSSSERYADFNGWSPKIHKRLFTQTQIFGLGRPILKRPPKIPIWQKCNSNKICTISKSIDTKEHCYIISIQLNHYIMFKNQQNCA